MTAITVGLTTPSSEILALAAAVANRMNIRLISAPTSLQGAFEAARHMMEQEHIDALIAFRGTARLLRGALPIPVLGMPDNTTRKLIAIREAAKISRSILVTLYVEENIDDLTFFESLFNVHLHCEFYRCEDDIDTNIRNGIKAKCGVVVGGGTSRRLARKYGLPGVIVLPSEQDFAVTLENAVATARARREEHDLLLRQQSVLNAVSEGIIAVDAQGCISTLNRSACELFNMSENAIGASLETLLPEVELADVIRGKPPTPDAITSVKGNLYVLNSLPIRSESGIIGGVCMVKPAARAMESGKAAQKAVAHGYAAKYSLKDFVHASRLMGEVVDKLRRYAACDSTVLLSGETGTGKEILAHALHRASKRCKGPFVSVNCSALPEQLLEAELFGYEGGAFTGSRREGRPGLFEVADEGTLFLDEVNSLSLNVQSHLLRFLQEKEIRRIGGRGLIPVRVRIVAASNRPLREEVRAGRMREDLFYRLNVLPIEIPPLRARPEDIPLLIDAFMHRISARNALTPFSLPAECVVRLSRLPWRGNARELAHVMERLVLLSGGHFQQTMFDDIYTELLAGDTPRAPAPAPAARRLTREAAECALREANGRRGRAAGLLGVSRATLWRLLRRQETEQNG